MNTPNLMNDAELLEAPQQPVIGPDGRHARAVFSEETKALARRLCQAQIELLSMIEADNPHAAWVALRWDSVDGGVGQLVHDLIRSITWEHP